MGKMRNIFVLLSVAALLAGSTSTAFAGEKPKKEKEKKSERVAQPGPASLEALEETIADLKAQVAELKAQVQKQELKSEAPANATSVAEKSLALPNPPATTAVAAIPVAASTPSAPAATAAPQNLTPPSNPVQFR